MATPLIPFNACSLYLAGGKSVNRVESPKADYDAPRKSQVDLQDALENHLAMYHYHTTALLALSANEDMLSHQEWEFGAHLIGHDLYQKSQELMRQYSLYRQQVSSK